MDKLFDRFYVLNKKIQVTEIDKWFTRHQLQAIEQVEAVLDRFNYYEATEKDLLDALAFIG